MDGDSRFKYGVAVTSLVVVVLLFLLVADFAAISALRKLLEGEIYRNAEEELSLVESSIKEPILRRDYALVEQFLMDWSKQHPHILGVKAIAPNGFLLFDYSRKLPSAHTFQVKHYVKFGGTTLSRLEAIYDLSAFDERIGRLTVGLIAGSAIFASFFGVVLWYVLRKTAMIPLEREIVERKKAQTELKRYADRLEESNRIKDLFADILSHDLMNPVNVVINYAELLLEREKNSTKREMIDEMLYNASRLTDMVKNASEYAKLENMEEIDSGSIDLGEIIRGVVKNFALRSEEKNIRVLNSAVGNYPVYGNRIVEDIFSNLLSNAIKFSEPDGRIEITLFDEDSTWLVAVKDFGEGIAAGDKENIFERFERAGKTDNKGTGLGLAIAKRIVELHNGKIWVEDNPEGGSIFFVSLPKEGKREA